MLEQNNYRALYGKPNFIDGASLAQKMKFQFIGKKRLANYSLIIHNGELVAIYRKGFYAKERDELIRNGCVYEFGDFETKAIKESPIFNTLFNCHAPLCRLFVCADLNLFNEKNCQCETARQLNCEACGLFVIQSNTFAGLSTSQLPYLGMLPSMFANKKSLIIHADPQYGPSVGFINDRGEFLASWPFVPESVMVAQDGQFEHKSAIDAYQYPHHDNGKRIHFGCKGVEFQSNKCIINVWRVVDRNMFPMRNVKRGILG